MGDRADACHPRTKDGSTRPQRYARSRPRGGLASVAPTDLTDGPRLLDRMDAALRARHYSPRTAEAYRAWVKRFVYFQVQQAPARRADPGRGEGGPRSSDWGQVVDRFLALRFGAASHGVPPPPRERPRVRAGRGHGARRPRGKGSGDHAPGFDQRPSPRVTFERSRDSTRATLPPAGGGCSYPMPSTASTRRRPRSGAGSGPSRRSVAGRIEGQGGGPPPRPRDVGAARRSRSRSRGRHRQTCGLPHVPAFLRHAPARSGSQAERVSGRSPACIRDTST